MKILMMTMFLILMCALSIAESSEYKKGDEVIFLYYGHDSKREVEQQGVILEELENEYIILPALQIHPFNTYVGVKKSKILRKAERQ